MSKAYTTTVFTSAGDPFEASFFVFTNDDDGAAGQVVHMERLKATFEFDEDARAAGNEAAADFVANLLGLAD